ncbi:hypothetical protein G6703_04970 [Polynucleobacter paneuropaeus]|nr:hypothetical protein G6703_04970 [Polynucleobacter paneuropaeus]
MNKNKSRKVNLTKTLIAQSIITIMGSPLIELCLSGTSITSNVAFAQGYPTCPSSTTATNTYDMYCGTIAAMQDQAANGAGYQPASTSILTTNSTAAQYLSGAWQIQAFSGGTLSSTPAVITVPAGQGTPTLANISSTFVFNCPGNTSDYSGTVSATVSFTDTETITSSTTTTNSNVNALGGATSVTIGYTPPSATGGLNGSGTQSFNYGSTTSSTSSNSSSTANTTTSTNTNTYSSPFSVAPGYGAWVSLTDNVTTYSGANWSSTVSLTGTLYDEIFQQGFISTQAPTGYSGSIFGESNSAANFWYAPSSWTSGMGNSGFGQLASPNGAYVAYPDSYSVLVFSQIGSTANTASVLWAQGQWYGTANTGMNLWLDDGACTGGCAGNFWATNLANTTVAWDSNTSPAYLAVIDNGNFCGFTSSGGELWCALGDGAGTISNPTMQASATPAQLLSNSTAFIATGTYSETTYDTNAAMGMSTPTLLTSTQITDYCANPNGQGTSAALTPSYMDGSNLLASNPNVQQASYLTRKKDLFGYDQNNTDPKNSREPIRERSADTNGEDKKLDGDRDDKKLREKVRKHLGKVVKLADRLVLRKDQYTVSRLPGIRVTEVVIESDNRTNYTGVKKIAPPKDLKLDRRFSRHIRIKKDRKTEYLVEKKDN